MTLDAAIKPLELQQRLASFPPPALVDVRRPQAFLDDPSMIPGALRRLPDAIDVWAGALEPWRAIVVYCVRGHEVGKDAAAALRSRGLDAGYLEGGLEAWRAAGLPTRPHAAPTRWVTRERPKIDRIACPWLVRRFIDPSAEFFYVPSAEVRAFAAADGAIPYDVPGVTYTHAGSECSFDAFVRLHKLDDAALGMLATIVRGADTGSLHLAAESAGLLGISRGLSTLFADDHTMLKWGMLVYDALYESCRAASAQPAARAGSSEVERA